MKCIIIDDEPMARKGMKRLVESRPELSIAAMLDSAEAATEWLGSNEADLIFLDIEMPGINGVEFARKLPRQSMVVFTTAYTEYAIDGFDVEALDYLVKPIDPGRFNKAVDRAISYKAIVDGAKASITGTSMNFIIVKSDRKYVRVRLDDILFVEGLKDYVIIHQSDKKVITRMTIKAMEDTLPHGRFLRVNKSFIVNKDKIDSFDNYNPQNETCDGNKSKRPRIKTRRASPQNEAYLRVRFFNPTPYSSFSKISPGFAGVRG